MVENSICEKFEKLKKWAKFEKLLNLLFTRKNSSIIYRGVGDGKLWGIEKLKNLKIGKILTKIQNGVKIIVHCFE